MITTRKRRTSGALTAIPLLAALLGGVPLPGAHAAPAATEVSASSSLPGTTPAALVDGDLAAGTTGAEWSAAAPSAWVELRFPAPRNVASVQVAGPSRPGSGAQLHGTLTFSDGSSVAVSGVDGGNGAPTTVAFTPREASWVRLSLSRTVASASVALREIAVHDAGTTPARWPASGPGYSVSPPKAVCSSGVSVPRPQARRLALVCPATGSRVSGTTTVVVSAPPREKVAGYTWDPRSGVTAVSRIASATADATGRAVLKLDAGNLPAGPLGVKVVAEPTKDSGTPPLFVQLVNSGGYAVPEPATASHAPEGMTLQWAEDFSTPLSASATGADADYATRKPEKYGLSQFGVAVFADPAQGAGTLATIPGGYLRVRAEPIGNRGIRAGWGQKYVAGMLSSSRLGGSGFSAQYGYFEARMLGAPGKGTWPAFWTLDSESATPRQNGTGELDAVELYGHNTRMTCHYVHDWGKDPDWRGKGGCPSPADFSDWGAVWHTYGMKVTPTATIFLVDGVEVRREAAVSHQGYPYFFMVNLALGGGRPVDLTPTGNVSDLYVDWVRVYT